MYCWGGGGGGGGEGEGEGAEEGARGSKTEGTCSNLHTPRIVAAKALAHPTALPHP